MKGPGNKVNHSLPQSCNEVGIWDWVCINKHTNVRNSSTVNLHFLARIVTFLNIVEACYYEIPLNSYTGCWLSFGICLQFCLEDEGEAKFTGICADAYDVVLCNGGRILLKSSLLSKGINDLRGHSLVSACNVFSLKFLLTFYLVQYILSRSFASCILRF